jgi:DNA-binding NarL/FixJ family response regulator
MALRHAKAAIVPLRTLPKLPLNDPHWRAIFSELRLSPQQVKIVNLVLRSAGDREIAAALGLAEPTVRTYLQRIFLRLGVRSRMELAMRILEVSHQIPSVLKSDDVQSDDL